jgi:AraC-like DNA-binding protein
MARLFVRDNVQGMVSVGGFKLLVEYLENEGVPRRDVISESDEAMALEHGGRYPAEAFCQVMLKAAQRLQDPWLGFHIGQAARPSILGALGYVLMSGDNLGGALLHLQRYHRLLYDINPLQPPFFSGDNLVLQWGISYGRPGALFDELALTGMVKLGRELCAGRMNPAAIDFVNPPPSDITPYVEFFQCPVRFAQPFTRVEVPLSVLQMPLRKSDPVLQQLMSSQVDEVLVRLPQSDDLVSSVRRVINGLTPSGVPELDQVAQELCMPSRVLYRRLMGQGFSFRCLREEVLGELAERHLRDEHLTLAEISARLGYTEQSAFTRAFKRWTGLTPGQWRAQQAARCEAHDNH